MEINTEYITLIGLMAALVAIITEVTKEAGIMKKIPTDLQVFVVSFITGFGGTFWHVTKNGQAITVYTFGTAIVCSFVVAYLAMFGWEKLLGVYNRFVKKEE